MASYKIQKNHWFFMILQGEKMMLKLNEKTFGNFTPN